MKTRYINHYSIEIDIKSDKYLKFDFVQPSNKDHWEGECNIYLIDLGSKEPETLISEGLSMWQMHKLLKFITRNGLVDNPDERREYENENDTF